MNQGGMFRRSSAACAALFAIVMAGTAQQTEDSAAADSTGTRACLPQPTIERTKVLNNRNIVFITHQDEIYNSELPKQCRGLNRRSLVNYGIANGRICAGDRFQVMVEPTPKNYLPGAVCELGTFVRITETELEDLMAMTDPDRERRSRGRSSREAVTTEQIELPRDDATTESTQPTPTE